MQRESGSGGGGGNKGTGAEEALTAGGDVCDVGVDSGMDDVDRGAVQGYAVLVERINDLVSSRECLCLFLDATTYLTMPTVGNQFVASIQRQVLAAITQPHPLMICSRDSNP